jgi:tRNA dimethylallyltransferase
MIVAIVGPTGIGKTACSIAVAKHFGTEIISGDSVQVYRGLDIGSAKITPEEMAGIRHHLIDILDPEESFSVALFQTKVRQKIADFESRGLMPLIVGGTGLYIKSVLYDYNFSQTKRDPSFQKQYQSYSNEALHQILLDVDNEAAKTIHPNNRKRVLQAIQRSRTNKVSKNTNKDVPVYDFVIIGLRLDRRELYPLLDERVDAMFEQGLEEEVRRLYDKGIKSTAVQAIGYKELYRYFDGTITFEEAIEEIKLHTRRLAKKQYTFFSNQFPVKWVDVNLADFDQTIDTVIRLIESEDSHETTSR